MQEDLFTIFVQTISLGTVVLISGLLSSSSLPLYSLRLRIVGKLGGRVFGMGLYIRGEDD